MIIDFFQNKKVNFQRNQQTLPQKLPKSEMKFNLSYRAKKVEDANEHAY